MDKFSTLLFDLDGTISESAPGIIHSLQYGLESIGIHETNRDLLQTFIGPPLNVQIQEVYHVNDTQTIQFLSKFRERYASLGLYECAPYEGWSTLLPDLQNAGYILAVASSKPEIFVRRILERFHFISYFSVITGIALSEEMSPRSSFTQKASIIEQTLHRLEKNALPAPEKKEAVLMIGDRHHDIRGAQSNSIASIGVTYGYGTEEELRAAHPTYLAHSVEEIRTLLL